MNTFVIGLIIGAIFGIGIGLIFGFAITVSVISNAVSSITDKLNLDFSINETEIVGTLYDRLGIDVNVSSTVEGVLETIEGVGG